MVSSSRHNYIEHADHSTANGIPTPGKLNPLDYPDDFFRVRLICNLLDTCGNCFDRGAAKKKLDFFLSFFQVG